MSVPQVLQHLCALDRSSPDFFRSLYAFIRLDEGGEYSLNLQHSDSVRLVDFLDRALDVIPVTDALFRRCLRRLRLICGHHNVLPSSHTIHKGLERTGESPVAYGGFADVWEGTYGGEKVCVKALRIYNGNTTADILAPFYGEAVLWKRLRHPNVVRFFGVTTSPFQILLEWMPNGTLTEYVNSHLQADRTSLLLDVAEGINYLHTCHMFHGDLKGPNILIDGHGHAQVSDFGLASIAHGKYSTGVKSDKGHTVRWSAPEVLFGAVPASKQADVFAFGMVVVEVFTGKVPFHNTISTAVSYKTMSGERPPRPRGAGGLGLSDGLWKMTECCWKHDPRDRLRTPEVVDLLREMYLTSPSNPFVDVISDTGGLVETTPQTDAALSPKLLDILRYREPIRKGAQDDVIPLSGVPKTTVGSFPKKPVNTRFRGANQGRNGQHPPQPSRPEIPNSVERETSPTEASPMVPTTPHQRTSNQVPEPIDRVQNPVDMSGISVQTVDLIHSDASSFTVVDGFVNQKPTEARGRRDGRGVGIERSSQGAENGNDGGRVEPPQPGKVLVGPDQDPAVPTVSSGRGLGPHGSESVGNGALLNTLERGGGGSRTSARSTTPTRDRGDNSKDGLEAYGGPELFAIPLKGAGGVRERSGGWGLVRVMAKVMGLHKQVQSRSDGTQEK